jgi:hypothetical protein
MRRDDMHVTGTQRRDIDTVELVSADIGETGVVNGDSVQTFPWLRTFRCRLDVMMIRRLHQPSAWAKARGDTRVATWLAGARKLRDPIADGWNLRTRSMPEPVDVDETRHALP